MAYQAIRVYSLIQIVVEDAMDYGLWTVDSYGMIPP